jgi:hypothetical protein
LFSTLSVFLSFYKSQFSLTYFELASSINLIIKTL